MNLSFFKMTMIITSILIKKMAVPIQKKIAIVTPHRMTMMARRR